MAKKSFYAVKTGRIPGIYKTWDDCKKQTDGFPGAIYKGFVTKSEAENFLESVSEKDKLTEISIDDTKTEDTIVADAVAYVDGSYEDSQKEFSYGLVIFYDGIEDHFYEKYNTPGLVEMRNVAGEIMGAQKAMQFCVDHNIHSLDLYYDYEGIEKWCTGVWKANKTGTKDYKNFYDKIKTSLKVNFHKVAAHTGDTYNELADQLAKSALGVGVIPVIVNGQNDMTANNIRETDLLAVFELLQKDIKDLRIENTSVPYGKGYLLITETPSKQKLKVVHYSKKNKIWIQGKKAELFNELSLYIVELLETDEVPQFLNTVYKLNIDKDVVQSELSQYCPNAYNELCKHEKIKNSVLQSIYNLKLTDEMFDLSFLVNPALRPLEGILKIALQDHDIPIRYGNEHYDRFFVFTRKQGKYYLDKNYKKPEHSQEFLNYISTAYTYFNNHRHNLSHWDNPLDEIDTTRVIKSITEAHTIIKDTLKIINDYFKL